MNNVNRLGKCFNAVIVSLFLGLSNSICAAEFTVDSTVDFVDLKPGDGICKTEFGTCTLRAAVQEANATAGPDTILVQEGTFLLNYGSAGEDLAAEGDLDLTDGVTIVGAGAEKTIIDGNGNHRLFDIWPKTESQIFVIERLTAQHGGQAETDGGGGGIRASLSRGGKLTLQDVVVTDNRTTLVPSNYAAARGGGILVAMANDGVTEPFTIIRTKVVNNRTIQDGGGIYVYGRMTGLDSEVSNNSAWNNGGGIFGDVSLSNVTLQANLAGPVGGGGGLYGGGTLRNVNVNSNFAATDGGGIYATGSLAVSYGSITYNRGNRGGGIFFASGQDAASYIHDTSITDNVAKAGGGGVWADSSGHLLSSVTVGANDGGTGESNIVGSVRVRSSIIANPVKGENCNHSQTSLGFNIASDGSCSLFAVGDRASLDPQLDFLANNGDGILTRAPKDGSPAIDAGSNTFCSDFDARLYKRADGHCDVGAIEAHATPASVGMVSFSSANVSVKASDGGVKVTINRANGNDGAVVATYKLLPVENVEFDKDQTSACVPLYPASYDPPLTTSWANGDSSPKTIEVIWRSGSCLAAAKTFGFKIQLLTVDNGGQIGGVDTTEIAVAGLLASVEPTPVAEKPVVSFGSATYSVNEADGELSIDVKRAGGMGGAFTVRIERGAGSCDYPYGASIADAATPMLDYQLDISTVTFLPGESTKAIVLKVLADQLTELDEFLILSLCPLQNNVIVTSPQSTRIAIVDSSKKFSSQGPPGPKGEQGKSVKLGGFDGPTFFLLFLIFVARHISYGLRANPLTTVGVHPRK